MLFSANVEKFTGIPRGRNIRKLSAMETAEAYFIEPLINGLRVHIHKNESAIRILNWRYNEVKDARAVAMDFWEMKTPSRAVFDGVLTNNRFKCMDVLLYEDEDLTDKPLEERKEYLARCEFGENIDVVPHRIINVLSDLKCEACVVKPANSLYIPDANKVLPWSVWNSHSGV